MVPGRKPCVIGSEYGPLESQIANQVQGFGSGTGEATKLEHDSPPTPKPRTSTFFLGVYLLYKAPWLQKEGSQTSSKTPFCRRFLRGQSVLRNVSVRPGWHRVKQLGSLAGFQYIVGSRISCSL